MTRDGPVGLTAAFVIDSGGRAAPLARRLGAVRRPLDDRLVCGWVYGEARTNADDAGFSTVEAVEDGWWYTARYRGNGGPWPILPMRICLRHSWRTIGECS
jgi:hypothetical protein